jgi:signal transduction histidine kinase
MSAGRTLVIMVAAIVIVTFLLISNSLIKEMAAQERERMNIWARATQQLAKAGVDSDIEFLLAIIAQNNSIPVMISDADGNISEFRNYSLPDKTDSDKSLFYELSERNKQFLQKRLDKVRGKHSLADLAEHNDHIIRVDLYDGNSQYIYYEDSTLLMGLSMYPYIQIAIMLVLAVILYLAVVNTKRAEQNRVWVGLSKETAHQLGTPISSLMAWVEYLQAAGVEPEVTSELDKDVRRLSTIADRFSKIGSQPDMQLEYLNETVRGSLEYMQSRVSSRVAIRLHLSDDDHGVKISRSLFEWVMENLTKNAVDAMQGEGSIDITTGSDKSGAWIEVADTGKGIARKNFKTVFKPGYTTKKRGWGLGLTLVKRIVEDYHGGRIYIKDSELGRGTTFRIEFPVFK